MRNKLISLIWGVAFVTATVVAQDSQEPVKWLRLAAEQGDPGAQTVLGAMYQLGDGVPQDYQEALKWYRLAAGQGDPRAQVQLGFKLQQEALTLQLEALTLQLEAEQGNPFAQATLGNMYDLGDGVSQNLIQAHKWFNLAASKATGEEREGYRSSRDAVAEDMTALQIAEAQRLAREWQPKTWEQLIAVRDEQ